MMTFTNPFRRIRTFGSIIKLDCSHVVRKMNCSIDDIHIKALTHALKYAIRINTKSLRVNKEKIYK